MTKQRKAWLAAATMAVCFLSMPLVNIYERVGGAVFCAGFAAVLIAGAAVGMALSYACPPSRKFTPPSRLPLFGSGWSERAAQEIAELEAMYAKGRR